MQSVSHVKAGRKLDFVIAPAKQFSLSALPGHCINLIALGVPKENIEYISLTSEWESVPQLDEVASDS